MNYPRIASLKSIDDFRGHLETLNLELPVDSDVQSGPESILAQSCFVHNIEIGNRFSILPMEGWDATKEGKPSDLTRRRWQNFGKSGAKLIWGGEAVAIRNDGRANPNQLLMTEENMSSIESLRLDLMSAHEDAFGKSDDLLVGLQITHSGRFARPNEKTRPEPRTVQRNPVLDARLGIQDDSAILSDDELRQLIDDFILAAVRAQKIGFRFVDVKHCHGYLGHELLSGVDRDGSFGGSFENRTRFLREIVAGIRSEAPDLEVGVRLSLFDFVPFHKGVNGVGEPEPNADPRLSFGCDDTGTHFNLSEPRELLSLLQELGIEMVCTSAGVPYATPHVQRPATFPPTDGYQPPEDPLVGVARQINVVSMLKKEFPKLFFIGSGYTYLQEWLPGVAQAAVRLGMVDSVGLGRMVLSYPEMPADVVAGRPAPRKKVCRTFSDCTSGPRNGMISGCFPLDQHYKSMPERKALAEIKKSHKA